jgi:hypothetical protein
VTVDRTHEVWKTVASVVKPATWSGRQSLSTLYSLRSDVGSVLDSSKLRIESEEFKILVLKSI